MTRDELMNHRQAYLDNQLDPKLAAQVEEGLKQNPDLAEQFAADRHFNHLVKTGEQFPAAFTAGSQWAFWVCVGISIVGLIATIVLVRPSRRAVPNRGCTSVYTSSTPNPTSQTPPFR